MVLKLFCVLYKIHLLIIKKTIFREVLVPGEVGDSLSSALAGLRESYYDYNMPKVSEM